jgi:hypothetical protein
MPNRDGHPATLVRSHPGNTNRLTHGAYAARRRLSPEALQLADDLMQAPHTVELDSVGQRKSHRFGPTVPQQATKEAICTFVHAVCLLARAPKSRMVDHAPLAMYEGKRPRLEGSRLRAR